MKLKYIKANTLNFFFKLWDNQNSKILKSGTIGNKPI